MRTAFIRQLIVEARRHPRIFLLVGDLGFSVVEPFAQEFPDRFLNAGVAEQNMTGVAAGLASEGWHVFTYSIANFPTLRCFEQIRNDVCYHNLPVTVVAVGAGLAYGNLGYSHHAVQDIAVMRSLPDLTLLSPADPGEAKECVSWLVDHPGPSYLRLGKAGEKPLHDVRGLDRGPLCLRQGDAPIAFVGTGSAVAIALAAADLLATDHGRKVSVFSCPILKPFGGTLLASLWGHRLIISIEEHVDSGGLGALLAGERPATVELVRLAIPEQMLACVGTQDYLRQLCGLTAERLAQAALEHLP